MLHESHSFLSNRSHMFSKQIYTFGPLTIPKLANTKFCIEFDLGKMSFVNYSYIHSHTFSALLLNGRCF